MKIKLAEAADRYGLSIFARMQIERAPDWSDTQIERCLGQCVCGPAMVKIAKAMRDHGHPLTLVAPYEEEETA